jgi:phosphoglycerate dehydrogenase-like enzyme
MAERMATWVIWGVISWQRKFEDYGQAQRTRRWDVELEGRTNLDNCDVRVGVLGFGGSCFFCMQHPWRVRSWGWLTIACSRLCSRVHRRDSPTYA